jgi:hypothetical protein
VPSEVVQQLSIVDIETEGLGGCVEIGAVDEKRQSILLVEIHSRSPETMPAE